MLFAVTTAATAAPKVSVDWTFYEVRGNTIKALRDAINKNGPRGYWALTTWYIEWTGTCQVSLKITYQMPKLMNADTLPAPVKSQWDTMYAALKAHEETHGAHGLQAAQELERQQCKNGNAIIDKWAAEDRAYDRRSNHGANEGIRF